MSHVVSSPLAILVGLTSTLRVTARQAVDAIHGWRTSRRAYRALCQMSDGSLKDLGLTRSDLRDASAVGLLGDPTLVIAERARSRRRGPGRVASAR